MVTVGMGVGLCHFTVSASQPPPFPHPLSPPNHVKCPSSCVQYHQPARQQHRHLATPRCPCMRCHPLLCGVACNECKPSSAQHRMQGACPSFATMVQAKPSAACCSPEQEALMDAGVLCPPPHPPQPPGHHPQHPPHGPATSATWRLLQMPLPSHRGPLSGASKP